MRLAVRYAALKARLRASISSWVAGIRRSPPGAAVAWQRMAVRPLIALVLLPRLGEIAGVVAQGLGQEPGAGQSQAGPATRQVGGAMCGVADEHDAAVVPCPHLD